MRRRDYARSLASVKSRNGFAAAYSRSNVLACCAPCAGSIGVFGHPEAANLAYLGLYALQHRGQESAGIVATDGDKLRSVREMGHVNDIFTADRLKDLPGHAAIGHVRYSTAGDSSKQNAQPIAVDYAGGSVARRPQRQPGQRGRAARAAGGRGAHLHDHLRHRGDRPPHRPLARADAARAGRRRAPPGARRLLAGLPDRGLASSPCAIRWASARWRSARRRQHLDRLLRDLRLRAARGGVRARHRAGRDGDHRSQRRAQRAPVRQGAEPPLRLRVGLLRAPRLEHRRQVGLPRARADGAPAGGRAPRPRRRGHPGARLGRGGRHRLRPRERHPLRPGADALALHGAHLHRAVAADPPLRREAEAVAGARGAGRQAGGGGRRLDRARHDVAARSSA